VGAGTDTPFIYLIPGFSLHDELALCVDAGLQPVDALRAATATNAKIVGLDGEIGRIKPGMKADLLAVRGNPLDRIDDLGRVELVVREGVRLDPNELQQAARDRFGEPVDEPIFRDLQAYVTGDMPTYAQR